MNKGTSPLVSRQPWHNALGNRNRSDYKDGKGPKGGKNIPVYSMEYLDATLDEADIYTHSLGIQFLCVYQLKKNWIIFNSDTILSF